jgi:hypothetical protein
MRLFVTSLMLLSLALPASGNQQQSEPQSKQGGATVAPNPSGGVTVIVNQPPSSQQTQSPQEKPHHYHRWMSPWLAPTTLLTLALVIIAAVGTKAALDSLEQVRKQAQSTEKAANAARDSADAVMRGERAWLLIDSVDADQDFASQGTPRFTYHVGNHGKTPGFIIGAKAYVQMGEHRDFPSDSSFMELKGSIGEDAVIVPNGELLTLYGNDLSMQERQFWLSGVADDERAKLFDQEPQAYLWAVGSIHYHDVFGNVHSTPFAFWWNVSDKKFVRARWPEINKPK